jgi:hypothetical protein
MLYRSLLLSTSSVPPSQQFFTDGEFFPVALFWFSSTHSTTFNSNMLLKEKRVPTDHTYFTHISADDKYIVARSKRDDFQK